MRGTEGKGREGKEGKRRWVEERKVRGMVRGERGKRRVEEGKV